MNVKQQEPFNPEEGRKGEGGGGREGGREIRRERKRWREREGEDGMFYDRTPLEQ